MASKNVKRVAIVGFGFMGRMHYANWKKVKGAQVVALCDKDTSQFSAPVAGGNQAGADASTDYGDAVIYDDFDRMIAEADLDAISLTLPTPLHVPLTLAALKAGVSVLCEKPMALSTADCDKMLAAEGTAPDGTYLAIAQCLRFWPEYAFLKKLVTGNKYGAVLAANFRRLSAPPGWGKGASWFADEAKSGGVALDLHIHDTDIIHYLFGMPKSVSSRAAFSADGAMRHIATLYDVGGAAVSAEGSWCLTPSLGFDATYTVVFEKATVVLDGKRAVPLCVYPAKGEPFAPKLPAGDGYEHEIRWFADLIRGKAVPLVTTPEESRDSVRIIEAEKRSARSGKPVVIK